MEISNEKLRRFSEDALLKVGEHKLARSFQIYWNPRMRSTAGRAKLQSLIVEMNPKLLPFGEKEVYTTVLHELAHLVAWTRSKDKGHGVAWKNACAELGIPNEKATHTLPLPVRTQRKNWMYKCPSCESSFKRARRTKAHSACAKCCKKYNNGSFSSRYLLDEFRLVYTEK